MHNLKKVLLFESRRLCYGSSQYFMQDFASFLQKKNITVYRFYYEDIKKNPQDLERFLGMSFDAVFDTNSMLPGVYSDKSLLLDKLKAPFFHRILDHPLHLHPSLEIALKNETVICLDAYHADYIRKRYPHIRHVIVMPIAGRQAVAKVPFEQREISLLYPSTYVPLSFLEKKICEINPSDLVIAKQILSKYLSGTKDEIHKLYPAQDAKSMYRARYVDRYIRQGLREYVLNEFLSHHVKLDILGDNWDMSPYANHPDITFHPACSYAQSVAMIANARAVLNVQPLFHDVMHDRVSNAFANRTAVITDGCDRLEQGYTDGIDYCHYDFLSLADNDAFYEKIQDSTFLKKIAENGYYAMQKNHHTYEDEMGRLLQEIDRIVAQ